MVLNGSNGNGNGGGNGLGVGGFEVEISSVGDIFAVFQVHGRL